MVTVKATLLLECNFPSKRNPEFDGLDGNGRMEADDWY
jgi:hypothetical protein